MTYNRDSDEALGKPLSVYGAGGVAGSNIFNGATHTIPLVDVSHIRKCEPESGPFPITPEGIIVFLRTTSSTIFLRGDEADEFKRAWGDCRRKMDSAAVEGMREPIASVDGDEFIKLISTCLKQQQDIDARRAKQPAPTSTSPSPFDQLQAKIQSDSDLAWKWHRDIALCHIDAMAAAGLIDGRERHKAAHSGAARFMRLCFGVDTTEHPDYPRHA